MGHWGTCPLEFDARTNFSAGGAHDAPPDPLVDWGADALSIPTPVGAFWRLDARAFGASFVVPPDTKSWRRHCTVEYKY